MSSASEHLIMNDVTPLVSLSFDINKWGFSL